MRNFILGLVLGVAIAGASTAIAATVLGTGYLGGWTVTYESHVVCHDPFVWAAIREIEC